MEIPVKLAPVSLLLVVVLTLKIIPFVLMEDNALGTFVNFNPQMDIYATMIPIRIISALHLSISLPIVVGSFVIVHLIVVLNSIIPNVRSLLYPALEMNVDMHHLVALLVVLGLIDVALIYFVMVLLVLYVRVISAKDNAYVLLLLNVHWMLKQDLTIPCDKSRPSLKKAPPLLLFHPSLV
jgi:hypothetical protein